MEVFRAVLKRGKDILHFRFTRMYTIKGHVYFVSVTGGFVSQYFQMEQQEGAWKIARQYDPPCWLLSCEEELAKEIGSNFR